ncbi:MAG: thioredoxin family protein [Arcobacter butzleri]|nr:thioredoxin family protein [Arcobacteraceae bacterium]NLO17506.1 thioredoxin family protein [Aliarcobacter butzleri]
MSDKIDELIKTSLGVMLYFSSKECGVCSVLKPKIDTMFEENFPKIKKVYIKSEENLELCAKYSVFTMPTLLVFLEGREFIRKSRNISLVQLQEELGRLYDLLDK